MCYRISFYLFTRFSLVDVLLKYLLHYKNVGRMVGLTMGKEKSMTMMKPKQKARVLVVQDEILTAVELAARIESMGYDIRGRETYGEKALERIDADRPDLVLMDIVLEGDMDGIYTARIIREKWGIPVVFLTTYSDAADLERAKMTRPFGYLFKPIRDRDLKVALDMALYGAKVERERKQAQERYRLLSENSTDMIIQYDLDGGMIYISPACLEITGYMAEELMNLDSTEYLHPDDIGRVQEEFLISLTTQAITYTENRVRHKDGRFIWLGATAKPIFDSGGKPAGLVTSARDITACKEVEEALKDSEKLLRRAIDSLDDAVHLVDCDIRVILFNRRVAQWCEQLNIPNMAVGRYLHEIFPFLTDDAIAQYRHVIDRRQPIKTQEETRLNGRLIITRTLKTPFYRGKQIAGVLTVVTDITELKETESALRENEERYRLIWENALEGIAILQDGKIVFLNPQAGKELGYSPEELQGRNFLDFLPPEEKERVTERYEKGLAGEKMEKFFPTKVISKNGEYRWLNVGGVPFTWKDRPAVLTFINDIHEQKLADEILKKGQRKLEELIIERTADLENTNIALKNEITLRKRHEIELKEYQKKLRNMSRELSITDEKQRKLFAAELHDNIGQSLTVLSMMVESLRRNAVDLTLENELMKMNLFLDGIIDKTKELTYQIIPPILFDLGIDTTLKWMVENYDNQYPINFIYQSSGTRFDLNEEYSVFSYKAVNELIYNAVIHAQAHLISVNLMTKDNALIIDVVDDGVGINRDTLVSGAMEGGYGLFSIGERLKDMRGKLEIESESNGGTKVSIVLPLNDNKQK